MPFEIYNKTIIGLSFCDMQNYKGLGKDSYFDIDNTAYPKHNNCLILEFYSKPLYKWQTFSNIFMHSTENANEKVVK